MIIAGWGKSSTFLTTAPQKRMPIPDSGSDESFFYKYHVQNLANLADCIEHQISYN